MCDFTCIVKLNERMKEMDKHQEFMRKLALFSSDDSFVSIPKAEYETLLRESETLRQITELFRRNTFMPEYTIRVMLGLGGENPDIVTPGRFEKEPPKEGN